MVSKSANTAKPSKPAGRAAKAAAKHSTKDGQKITRTNTNARQEIRAQNTQRHEHPE